MRAGPSGKRPGGRQSGGTVGLSQLRTGGPATAANILRRALGVLWLADALVKILIPFGDRAAGQWYEQIMTAETGPPGLHYLLAWETNLFAAHPFWWWLPAGVELCIGGWLVTRPASRRALAVSAAWAVIVWVAAEGMGGLFGGVSSVLTGYPGAALLYGVAAAVLWPARRPREAAAAAAEAGLLGLYWSRVASLAHDRARDHPGNHRGGSMPGSGVHGLPRHAAPAVPVADRADHPGGVGGHGEPRRHPHRLNL